MWIFTNTTALSVVQLDGDPATLLVRSRLPGDISVLFPDADVWTDLKADYPYRALVPRVEVEEVISAEISRIDYRNFKDSIAPKQKLRKRVCSAIWSAFYREAPRPKGAQPLFSMPGLDGLPPELPADVPPAAVADDDLPEMYPDPDDRLPGWSEVTDSPRRQRKKAAKP